MKHYGEELNRSIATVGKFQDKKIGSNDLTFVGVLRRYFEPENEQELENVRKDKTVVFVRQNWNVDEESITIAQNINDYARDILPSLDREKALKDYTEEDFASILTRIQVKCRKEGRDIGEDRLAHFEDLLRVVYRVGVNNGLFEDLIGKETEEQGIKDEAAAKRTLLPKSLTLEQERFLLKMFFEADICTMKGELLAAFLQFFTGLRNEEATALLYRDIQDLPSGGSIFKVYKSSPGRGGNIRLSMKSSNAYRLVPVFDFLSKRLKKRRDYLQELNPNVDVNLCPIACKNLDYQTTIGSATLTESGKDLLMSLPSPNKDLLPALQKMLINLQKEGVNLEEKDPTSYLFRRNYATHLHNLGLSEFLCEFIIGHEIQEQGVERNHFVSDEEQEKIQKVFLKHPFNTFFSSENANTTGEMESSSHVKLEVEPNTLYRINVNESSEDVVFNMDEKDRTKCMVLYGSSGVPCKSTVDISGIINKAYENA